ncbi:hypothetical protein PSAB6_460027 [Paraburkholderia sabiae]|nr:hypothetical protein PSAB6_460027 [Paraburkholderia sabiae]
MRRFGPVLRRSFERHLSAGKGPYLLTIPWRCKRKPVCAPQHCIFVDFRQLYRSGSEVKNLNLIGLQTRIPKMVHSIF